MGRAVLGEGRLELLERLVLHAKPKETGRQRTRLGDSRPWELGER
jgi:hypothetical protein